MEWIFSGIGTAILGFIVGGATGSIITGKIVSKRTTQKQVAGDNSTQSQVGRDLRYKK